MSRALVTFGVGAHAELLNIALPSFREFAGRHGYELALAEPGALRDAAPRPASWLKIPLLQAALAVHDEVLWLDADVVIVDGSEDIAASVPDGCWQAVAEHDTPFDGKHPNLGVWLVRRPMIPWLRRAWQLTAYLHHPWWEQAAILELMGFEPTHRPVRFRGATRLYDHTHLLDGGWNALPGSPVAHRRFMHSASRPDRLELMRSWADATLTQDPA